MTNATSNHNNLRNSNFGSGRQSIIDKYDKNGDGKIDLDELNGFVDDYILSINNNNTLLDSNSNLRKMIGFGSILILILSLSNLGTAILAANISKEAVIVDGRFVTNDGSAKTISTMNTVESVTKTWEPQHRDSRNLAKDGADTATTDTTASQFTCFTKEEVDTIFEASKSGSGTNLIMEFAEDDGSITQTVVPIHGTGHSTKKGVSFPDSNVELVLDDKGLCKESRWSLYGGADKVPQKDGSDEDVLLEDSLKPSMQPSLKPSMQPSLKPSSEPSDRREDLPPPEIFIYYREQTRCTTAWIPTFPNPYV